MASTELKQLEIPGFLTKIKPEDVKVTGLEDMAEDFSVPRIQLAQGMSDQIKKRSPSYIEGLEEGMYFHSITQKVLGEEFVTPILKIWSSRTLFDEDTRESMCWSPDMVHGSVMSELCVNCVEKDWHDGTPPACQTFQNHLVVVDGQPAILSIKLSNKEATAEARKIRTLAKLIEAQGVGLYAALFHVRSLMVQGTKGTYYVTSATPAGYVKDEAEYHKLAALAEQFKDINQPPEGFGPKNKEVKNGE